MMQVNKILRTFVTIYIDCTAHEFNPKNLGIFSNRGFGIQNGERHTSPAKLTLNFLLENQYFRQIYGNKITF